MRGRNLYLVTSLAGLGELGSVPPLSPGELVEHLDDADNARRIVEAVLLGDDLLQRDAFLAGEIDQVSPAVLNVRQARNEESLPDFIAVETQGEAASARSATDTIWADYFRHAAGVARETGSEFLQDWVRDEVGLRNALTAARAKALDLDAAQYLVAPELGSPPEFYDSAVAEWSAAADPLAALAALDRWRWNWLNEHDRYFSFADDELGAYAARLMLLHRWHRLNRAKAGNDNDQSQPSRG